MGIPTWATPPPASARLMRDGQLFPPCFCQQSPLLRVAHRGCWLAQGRRRGSGSGSEGCILCVEQPVISSTSPINIAPQSSRPNRRCALSLDDCLSAPNSRRCRRSLIRQLLLYMLRFLRAIAPVLYLPRPRSCYGCCYQTCSNVGVHHAHPPRRWLIRCHTT